MQDFANVNIDGGLVSKTITIENQGNETLLLNDIRIEGTNASEFTLDNQPTQVNGGETVDISITFNPEEVNQRNATLVIDSNDLDEETYTINLTGIGTQPDINVQNYPTGSSLDLGSLDIQENTFSPIRTVTIENLGIGLLDLESITIEGDNFKDFSILPYNRPSAYFKQLLKYYNIYTFKYSK